MQIKMQIHRCVMQQVLSIYIAYMYVYIWYPSSHYIYIYIYECMYPSST